MMVARIRVMSVNGDGKIDILPILISKVKCVVTPKSILQCFHVICRHIKNHETFEAPEAHIRTPSQLTLPKVMVGLTQPLICKQASSSQSIWGHFFFFFACLCFLLVILLFKMTPPGAVLKRYLLSLIAHKRVMMCLPEEIHIRHVTTVEQQTTLFETYKIKN